jgi:hypothetical protein
MVQLYSLFQPRDADWAMSQSLMRVRTRVCVAGIYQGVELGHVEPADMGIDVKPDAMAGNVQDWGIFIGGELAGQALA